jgi:hypothetical protein
MEDNYIIITAKNTTKAKVMDCVLNGVQYETCGQNVDIWAYSEEKDGICESLADNGIEYYVQ